MSDPHTVHGGRLADARARFGGDRADWLDLSTGINPNAWMPPGDAAPDWRALPDPRELAGLEQTAAAYFGADPALCAAVPGSEAGLRALARVLGLPGLHLPLCYGTYAQAFGVAGATGRVPSVLVVGNPNNPDGAIVAREALLAVLAQQEQSGGWLIVDEAFADCAPEWSVADEVAQHRRLIVTRSFGKFFGLAGVRLGFVLAPSALLAELRHLQGEWPVCSAALSFGSAAYADAPWIARTRAALAVGAALLDEVLAHHGLAPRGSCPLFRLAETPAGHGLFAALARRHILTRPFAEHPALLRFGLPVDTEALDRLDAALTEACSVG
jgi:cobalamin biosynthetic protein CobC